MEDITNEKLLSLITQKYYDDKVHISANKNIEAWKNELKDLKNKNGFDEFKKIHLKDFNLLKNDEAITLAKKAFDDYFIPRLTTRYLNPIQEMINYEPKNEDDIGIGFSIVSLECILIEFLASINSGRIYVYCKPPSYTDSNPVYIFDKKYCILKNDFEKIFYSDSKNIFIDFLINFDVSIFNKNNSDEFYKDIRCGLIHSLKTKKDWKIKKDEEFNYIDFEKKIIQRTKFFDKITDYINTDILNKIKSDAQYARNFLFVLDCHFRR